MVLDSGDTAWMLVAGSLVLLMIPALGLFESGLLRKKKCSLDFHANLLWSGTFECHVVCVWI